MTEKPKRRRPSPPRRKKVDRPRITAGTTYIRQGGYGIED